MLFPLIQISLVVIGSLTLISIGGFGVVSMREHEPRAALISVGLAVLLSLLFFLVGLLASVQVQTILLISALGIVAILAVLFLLPVGKVDHIDETPQHRFDERDTMFGRSWLQPGSENYEAYYQMRPENKDSDELTRSKPGLYAPDAMITNPLLFASSKGSFSMVGTMRNAVDGRVAEERQNLSPDEMSAYLKKLALFYGALDVGITKLEPYHVYSHIGRGTGEYGAPIEINHQYAIAFTVEMDYDMTHSNPSPQETMEVSKQYVESGRIAIQLAAAIRAMGYPARAHIHVNYRVIAPLVARDAGLGEIGRMGLLMTPNQGTRVRLAAVTTSLELIADEKTRDGSIIDFCNLCMKCAENCPSHSIPPGDREEIDGAYRWRINADTCHRYWMVLGVDCGRCVAVCPYAHPDNVYHNLIRWGISKSGLFRRAAIILDDLFYGKNPTAKNIPDWTDIQPE